MSITGFIKKLIKADVLFSTPKRKTTGVFDKDSVLQDNSVIFDSITSTITFPNQTILPKWMEPGKYFRFYDGAIKTTTNSQSSTYDTDVLLTPVPSTNVGIKFKILSVSNNVLTVDTNVANVVDRTVSSLFSFDGRIAIVTNDSTINRINAYGATVFDMQNMEYTGDDDGSGIALAFADHIHLGIEGGTVNAVVSAAIFVTHIIDNSGSGTVTVTSEANAPNDDANNESDEDGTVAPFTGAVKTVTSDTAEMRVYIEWDRTSTEIQGTPTVNGIPISVVTGRVGATYRGYVDLPAGAIPAKIDAVFQGTTYSVPVTADAGPVIQTATFDLSSYPNVSWAAIQQTELKDSDQILVDVTTDILADRYEFELSQGLAATASNFADTLGTSVSATANTADVVQTARSGRVRARSASTGAFGPWFQITNSALMNNLAPSISIDTVNYPASQSAFKDVEIGSVDNVVTDFSEILYTSPHGDFTISNDTTYEDPKTITCTNPGDYNDSSANFRIRARQITNGTQTTVSDVIEVADIAPVVTITQPQARLRSGGNDGTAAQNYVITATSNQNLASAPLISLNIPVDGTWQGANFAGSNKIWTRTIQIHDDDAKGSGAWAFTATPENNAGIPATITGTQVNGGFVSRGVLIQSQQNETVINVDAVTYAKVTLSWTEKTLPNQRAVGTTATPDANSWCLNSLSPKPNIVRILDTGATIASTKVTTVTLEELV